MYALLAPDKENFTLYHPYIGNNLNIALYIIAIQKLWEEEIKGKKKSQPDEIVTTSLLTLRSNLIKIEYYNFSNRVQV
jgi:hypothetical protein